MRQDLTIRKASTSDAPQISELIRGVAHYFSLDASGDVPAWFLATITPSAIAGYIEKSRFNYLVGFAGPALAGVVAVRDGAHIHHLFVASEFHHGGVAAALWRRAKSDALASGNRGGFSVRSSEFAVPVYERFGFRVTGPREEQEGIAFVPMKLESSHEDEGGDVA